MVFGRVSSLFQFFSRSPLSPMGPSVSRPELTLTPPRFDRGDHLVPLVLLETGVLLLALDAVAEHVVFDAAEVPGQSSG